MIYSRSRSQASSSKTDDAPLKEKQGPKIPDVETCIQKRDYVGAVALLEFKRQASPKDVTNLEWLAYCYFHYGEHRKAVDIYLDLLSGRYGEPNPIHHTYAACCFFYLAEYKVAEEHALKGPSSKLQTRILFHVAHKFNDESKLMMYHQQLTDSTEDQLSLAAIHYLRSHFQEATDIYKRLLLETREYLALNVYVALCYCKLDYYDVSLEILAVYLQAHPESALAINLKACNHFRLYNGKAAEAEIKALQEHCKGNWTENDLVRHNLVVFRNGENALQVLPPLLDSPPEGRLNLVIYYLRNGDVNEAHTLIKDLEPTSPQEYILKAVVHSALGQENDQSEHLKMAQQYFQLVGASASECDTIPGRQCMASCFFLLKQFEDVLVYLKSIKTYFNNDDDFNWNYGIAKAAVKEYQEAEEGFQQVQNEKYRSDPCFISWLARCYIANGKARLAWELYLRMETSDDSFNLLQLIANDCYEMGAFFFAAKAFDVLERLDPSPEYWEGMRGAAVGVFQMIIARKEPKESLRDILSMLRNTSNPQVEYMIRVMTKWAKENGLKIK